MTTRGKKLPGEIVARITRLRGVLDWNTYSEYDQRLTDAHKNLRELNQVVDQLHRQYTAFVRTRQAAMQSYQGYDNEISRQRTGIKSSREKVGTLMARQGHMLETLAMNELTRRRQRLEEFQVKARFAMADSYDRASGAQDKEKEGQ
jgi:predicted  nucleic acid-binding Zn-ribbon protein